MQIVRLIFREFRLELVAGTNRLEFLLPFAWFPSSSLPSTEIGLLVVSIGGPLLWFAVMRKTLTIIQWSSQTFFFLTNGKHPLSVPHRSPRPLGDFGVTRPVGKSTTVEVA